MYDAIRIFESHEVESVNAVTIAARTCHKGHRKSLLEKRARDLM
jgi:hypothetical protein